MKAIEVTYDEELNVLNPHKVDAVRFFPTEDGYSIIIIVEGKEVFAKYYTSFDQAKQMYEHLKNCLTD